MTIDLKPWNHQVDLPLDRAFHPAVMSWLNRNCDGDWDYRDDPNTWIPLPGWENQYVRNPDPIVEFYFEKVQDAVMFKLAFSGEGVWDDE